MSSGAAQPHTLRGAWLWIARGLWFVIVVPSMALGAWGFVMAAGRPVQLLDPNVRDGVSGLGLSALQGMLLFRLLPTVTICALGLLVFALRSDDRFAIYASVFYVTGGLVLWGPLVVLYQRSSLHVPVRATFLLGAATTGLALCLFPDGHFRPRWARLLAACAISYAAVPRVQEFYLSQQPAGDLAGTHRSIQIGTLVLFGGGFVAQFVRYRRHSSAADKRHIRWVVGSAFGLFVLAVQMEFARALAPGHVDAWLGWSSVAALVPIFMYQLSLTAAVVRHGLFDISRIVNRALVYGTVTGVLGAGYAGVVFLLSAVTRPLTGGSDLAVAASILAVAALFRPLRGRVQRIVDRRFNRSRYDAARTIEAFTTHLRDEVDIDALGAELQDVVGRTMQPAHVTLWLR